MEYRQKLLLSRISNQMLQAEHTSDEEDEELYEEPRGYVVMLNFN